MRVVLVTGDRNWGGPKKDEKVMQDVLDELRPDILIEGEARGADLMSRRWAEREGYTELNINPENAKKDHIAIPPNAKLDRPRFVPFPAQWKLRGRAAGPIRNIHMRMLLEWCRDQGWETVVCAFHHDLDNSKGTKHMVTDARKHDFEVRLYG